MSAKPVIELVSFTASEAFLADNSLISKVKDWLDKNVDGDHLNVFWGFEVQQPTQAYIFVSWPSFDLFTKTSQHPDFIPGFMVLFQALVTAPPTVQHIDFYEDPTNAFSAPITELIFVAPKEGHTQAEVDELTEQIRVSVGGLPGVHLPLVRGPIRNTPQYAQAAGWDSIEAHSNAVKTPPVDTLGAQLFGITDVAFKHITLRKA